ncbi:HET domain-containing protein [Neurospora intermedia]|uniref:HET domain-containing protein n=1 Tax=Neurospora intermedia TaxID=5142 RepID=A0ABR3D0K7_NEUIN
MATPRQTQARRFWVYLEQQQGKMDPETLVDGTKCCSRCLKISARLEKLIDRDFALEASNDPGKIGGRLVGPYADFELFKSWFDNCTLHHGTTTCRTDASILGNIPGLRVIDCSSRRLGSGSQLPTNQDLNYVALSYVWGTKPDDENEGENISDRTVGWPLPSKLPPLIEDIITAVTKLGFRYLWIDRYCIPQGDQEAKHKQIQNMDSIYGSASLKIIAAAGDDPSDGLPGVAAPSVLRDSKWNSRAWTMQKAFLSCRCLVFFNEGAYFQCSSPRSYRFEAIYEPPALLQSSDEVYRGMKGLLGRDLKEKLAGDLELHWCDYFLRRMTFEEDTLNAFSGILKYMHSLPQPVPNLWGLLMLPEVVPTSFEQRIRYNLIRSLAWSYCEPEYLSNLSDLYSLGKLGRTTGPLRKEMFPSWTWADWRPRVELHDEGGSGRKCDISYLLKLLRDNYGFTSLADLSVELDDGRIVSWAQGYLYGSDVSWLATLPNPPRILHIHGYTANPQLRYMTEKDWAEFNERTILPECWLCFESHRWIFIDADGQHLQPLLESASHDRCWEPEWVNFGGIDRRNMQRGNQADIDAIKPYTECSFDFRVIVLGYDQRGYVYYMMLMKAPGTDNQTETFERVNVLHVQHHISPSFYDEDQTGWKEYLARLTGKHAEPCRGTPWVKMNTRIA